MHMYVDAVQRVLVQMYLKASPEINHVWALKEGQGYIDLVMGWFVIEVAWI